MLTAYDLFLKPLSDFFTTKNLDEIKNDFIRSHYDENTQLYTVSITDEGIYDNEYFTSFNDVYLMKFQEVVDTARSQVSVIMANGVQDEPRLVNYIQKTLKSFLNKNSEILKKIPEVKSEIDQFRKYLLQDFDILLVLKSEKFSPTSVFGYKKYGLPVLRKLYSMSVTDSLIFDVAVVSEDRFIKVLTDSNINMSLQFACSTPMSVGYLITISKLFRRLNKKNIVASNRFTTQLGTPISTQNFDTSKSRFLKNKELQNNLSQIAQFIDKQLVK